MSLLFIWHRKWFIVSSLPVVAQKLEWSHLCSLNPCSRQQWGLLAYSSSNPFRVASFASQLSENNSRLQKDGAWIICKEYDLKTHSLEVTDHIPSQTRYNKVVVEGSMKDLGCEHDHLIHLVPLSPSLVAKFFFSQKQMCYNALSHVLEEPII